MTILSLNTPGAARLLTSQPLLANAVTSTLVTVVLIGTAFLFLLNVALAIAFRKRRLIEVLSFVGAMLVEVAIFVFALLLRTGILTHIPFSLPAGLPIDRAEIGATLALAIGLFPAAYWHRTSLSQLRQRMADDAKVIKNREGGVHVRSNAPGEWLN